MTAEQDAARTAAFEVYMDSINSGSWRQWPESVRENAQQDFSAGWLAKVETLPSVEQIEDVLLATLEELISEDTSYWSVQKVPRLAAAVRALLTAPSSEEGS